VLTPRRKEFLDRVTELARRTGGPVHYVTVADELGVSKWTAYDMLKQLERDGFLVAEYAVGPGQRGPGRSQIVFRPRATAGAPEGSSGLLAEWHRLYDQLRHRLKELRHSGLQQALARMMRDLPLKRRPVAYCASTLSLLLLYAEALAGRQDMIVRNIVALAPRPEVALTLFTGSVLSIVASRTRWPLKQRLSARVRRYLAHLADMTAEERDLLFRFLREALERGQPQASPSR